MEGEDEQVAHEPEHATTTHSTNTAHTHSTHTAHTQHTAHSITHSTHTNTNTQVHEDKQQRKQANLQSKHRTRA